MKKSLKWIGIIFLGLIILGVVFSGGEENEPTTGTESTAAEQEAPAPEEKTAAVPEPETTKFIKSGMYKIGQDLSAGEYVLYPDGMGYFQVSKDSTGSFESIIANDNFSGTRYLSVIDGQYLEIKNAKMLPEVEAEVQQSDDGRYPEGMYKIGKDISGGEYKVASTGGLAYLEVSKDSKNGFESIVSNDNFEGEKYITVKDGQYLKINGAVLVK